MISLSQLIRFQFYTEKPLEHERSLTLEKCENLKLLIDIANINKTKLTMKTSRQYYLVCLFPLLKLFPEFLVFLLFFIIMRPQLSENERILKQLLL